MIEGLIYYNSRLIILINRLLKEKLILLLRVELLRPLSSKMVYTNVLDPLLAVSNRVIFYLSSVKKTL